MCSVLKDLITVLVVSGFPAVPRHCCMRAHPTSLWSNGRCYPPQQLIPSHAVQRQWLTNVQTDQGSGRAVSNAWHGAETREFGQVHYITLAWTTRVKITNQIPGMGEHNCYDCFCLTLPDFFLVIHRNLGTFLLQIRQQWARFLFSTPHRSEPHNACALS